MTGSHTAFRGALPGLVLALVALLGLGAFLWLGRESRGPRLDAPRAMEPGAELAPAEMELELAPTVAAPVTPALRERLPESDSATPGEALAVRTGLGSVVVQVFLPDGTPAEGTSVQLWVLAPGDPRPRPDRRVAKRSDASAPVRSGRARFEGLELGRELTLEAASDSARGLALVVGPQEPGESVDVVLRLQPWITHLVFRALDPSGRPVLGDLQTDLYLGSKHGLGSSRDTRSTDANGFFEVELEAMLRAGERRELEVRTGALARRIDLSQAFPPDRIDMGDLRLNPAILLAEGRTVDGAGEPLADVTISYICRNQARGGQGALPLLFVGSVATDPHGAFSVYGLVEARSVNLRAERGALRAEPLEVALGTRGLEFVLAGAGSLTGSLLLEAGTPPSPELRLTLGGRDMNQWPRSVLGADGAFEFPDVAPGTYTLQVLVRGEVRAEVTDLVVVEGELTRDPRIHALDLGRPLLREPGQFRPPPHRRRGRGR